MFEYVNENWMDLMQKLKDDPNTQRGTHIPTILESLSEMQETLERIQKELDQYLEKKRQSFPRFYFLSNEDLLEVLGQSRDPNALQKHLKKCFEAINRLQIEEKDGGRGLFATKMISPEKEVLELYPSPVQVDHKAVEEWLKEIETRMRTTVKQNLFLAYKDARAQKKKDDVEKWVKKHCGQALITASQVSVVVDFLFFCLFWVGGGRVPCSPQHTLSAMMS